MGKNNFDAPNSVISESLFIDYINEAELYKPDEFNEQITLLVNNGMACKLTGTDSLLFSDNNTYRTACKFIQKYNSYNKKFRRRITEYEFGGENGYEINNNTELLELAKMSLNEGVYFCQMDDKNYAKLIVKFQNVESEYNASYEFYIIGKNWKKWRDKFYDMIDKYKKLSERTDNEYIYYGNEGRNRVNAIFKPFDHVIMKDKDELLRYIDNWVDNIPVYYDKYHMISKLSIMLYGEPGTGKSTVAKAIAKHLNIKSVTSIGPDYFYSNDVKKKSSGSYSSERKTVYTIDDIDCICKSREDSDDKNNNEILSSLLAFLDNPPTFFFKAKNGMDYPISIVIATTNYYDKLDAAVKRYGRFDKQIEMTNFNKERAQEMCQLYDLKLSDLVKNSNEKDFTISPSYLQALCLENIDKSLKNINNKRY